MAERITVVIEGENKDLVAACAGAVAAIHGVDKAASSATKTQAKQHAEIRRGTKDVDEYAVALTSVDDAITRVNRNFTFARNAMRTLKWPALAAGAGMAGGALAQLAAGLFAVASATGPAAGGLIAIPQAASAVVQAIGTVTLASGGVSEALKAQSAAQLQAGQSAVQSAQQQEAAALQITNAKQRLSDAERAETQARQQVTLATSQARTELLALQQAAEQTALSERRAQISLEEAIQRRNELRRTAGASALDIESADLSVDEARNQLEDIRRQHREQERQIAQTKARGLNQTSGVVKARQQLADAERETARATADLARAQRDAARTARDQSAAQDKVAATMANLSPAAREFVQTLLAYKPAIADLRAAAGEGLFPGVIEGLHEADDNLGVFRTGLHDTGEALGGLAEQAGELVGSKAFGKDLAVIMGENVRLIDRGGRGAINLTQALVDMLVAGEPFVDWLSKTTLGWTRTIEQWADAKRESGEATRFFRESRDVLEDLGSIVGDVGGAFLGMGRAAYPVGRDLLGMLRDNADEWHDWVDSIEGQNTLREYFVQAEPVLVETGRLVRDITTAFFDLGNQPGNTDLIRQIRTEALPALHDLLDNLSGSFGPELVDTATQLLGLFAEMSEQGGGLTLAVHLIGQIVEGVTWLLDNVPGLAQTMSVGFAGMSLYKLLAIGPAIKGVQTLTKLIRGAGGAAAVTGAAEAVAGGAAAGAAGGGAAGTIAKIAGGGGAAAAARTVAGRAVPVVGTYMALAAILNSQVKPIEKIAAELDQLNAPASGDTRLKQLTRQLDDAAKAGDQAKLRKIAGELDEIRGRMTGPEGDLLKRIADDVRKTAQEEGFKDLDGALFQVRRGWQVTAQQSKVSLADIRTRVGYETEHIKDTLGTNTEEGRIALSQNFKLAVKAIRQSMRDGTTATDKGLAEIQKLMVEQLQLFGFTPRQAKIAMRGRGADGQLNFPKGDVTGNPGTSRQFAGGGFLGQEGQRGTDTQLVKAGLGEAILTGPQQGVVNTALGAVFGTDLNGVFAGVTTPHFQAPMGFARGGIVPIPGQPGEFISQSILGDVLAIVRRYKAHVTDGYAPTGHAAGGEHPLGLAVDLVPGPGGSWDLIDQLAHWAEPSQNHPRYPFRWVGYDGDANHGRGNHLHLSWLHDAHIRGALGAAVKKVKWTGPGGMLGQIGQAGLDRVRAAANSVLDNTSAPVTGRAGATPPPGVRVSGNGADLMRQISRQRGWNFADWWALDGAETSHGANLSNPTSTARLRGQFLDMNWGKYGPGSDPRRNPSMAQQIYAFAAYIGERYGNPTAAWAFHQLHNYYALGGIVGAAKGLPPNMHAGTGSTHGKPKKKRRGGLGAVRGDLRNAIAFRGLYENFLSVAELNDDETKRSTFDDNLYWLRGIEGADKRIVRLANRLHDYDAMGQYAGDLKSTREQIDAILHPPTDTATPADNSALLAAIQADNDTLRRGNYLAGLQFSTLRNFAPLVGGRLVGSFAHGTREIRQDGIAAVHAGEQIKPDPEGPYGSQMSRGGSGGDLHLTLVLEGDGGMLIKRVVRAELNGQPAATSRVTGRTTRLLVQSAGR